jgi:NAD(P)-dependent dehydrogenase (short-subunit alcohol dehydrogenase family)
MPSSVCGAVESLARALAVELAPIRVNALRPGLVRTPMWDFFPQGEREAMFAAIGGQLPVGRVGEAADIARAALYLMSQEYSSGDTITLDGGGLLV